MAANAIGRNRRDVVVGGKHTEVSKRLDSTLTVLVILLISLFLTFLSQDIFYFICVTFYQYMLLKRLYF